VKIRVPMMIQDPKLSKLEGLERIREKHSVDEGFFLDGPVSRRVAILDLDPKTGRLESGIPFRPPAGGQTLWRYALADEADIYARDTIALSVFGTVLRTMYMFEEKDALGRKLVWGFDGPQLLVIPRAGERANAFYQRASRSLQFFFFPNPRQAGDTVYTSLSRDIVAHETGHAILDGIAPGLYNAITPQSLALHEAVADLTAALMAFRSHSLRRAVLAKTGGSIEDAAAFGSIGEEFGLARYNLGYLRDLRNDLSMNDVDHGSPHELSQVLSGALYHVMQQLHKAWWQRTSPAGQPWAFSTSGGALFRAAEQFKRMIFRALDYLPPGEVSFADYGRAILAADQASHPDSGEARRWIRREWVRRGIVPNAQALRVRTDYAYGALEGEDLRELIDSDWAAYKFANGNRRLLRIPKGVPFHVEPRLDVSKRYYHRGGKRPTVRECLFKVRWTQTEPNAISRRWPWRRRISVGTTLAIDWQTRKIRVLLTTNRRRRPEEEEEQRRDRDLLLQRLAEEDLMRLDDRALAHDGQPLGSMVQAESRDGALKVKGTARMLHIIGEA
jgi:hypothetical protein